MGAMLPVFSVPLLCLALVSWAAAQPSVSRRHRGGRPSLRRSLLACGVMTLLRTGGIGGGNLADLHWRWTDDSRGAAARCRLTTIRLRRLRCPRPLRCRASQRRSRHLHSKRRRCRHTCRGGAGTDGNGSESHLARLSRTRSRQHRSRCAHRHRLVANAARAAVASADRTRVVVLRGARQRDLHAGAAR